LTCSRPMDAKGSGQNCSRRFAPGRRRGAIPPLRCERFGMFPGTAHSIGPGDFTSSKAPGCRRGILNWNLRNDTADSEQIFASQWRTTRLANPQRDPTRRAVLVMMELRRAAQLTIVRIPASKHLR